MRVLIVGHPRSGTGYAAHCFRQCHWRVGHEVALADGIASWQWAVDTKIVPWGYAREGRPLPETVLHVLRDPADCVMSTAYTEQGSEAWRREHVKIPIDHMSGPIERAIWSIFGWTRLIEKLKPTHTAKLASVERAVGEITGTMPIKSSSAAVLNARPHPTQSADEIKAMRWFHPETATFWDRISADYAAARGLPDE